MRLKASIILLKKISQTLFTEHRNSLQFESLPFFIQYFSITRHGLNIT